MHTPVRCRDDRMENPVQSAPGFIRHVELFEVQCPLCAVDHLQPDILCVAYPGVVESGPDRSAFYEFDVLGKRALA